MISFQSELRVSATLIFLIALLLGSCATQYPPRFQRFFKQELKKPGYAQHFTGILILNADTSDTLYTHQAERYFTPASNTKIATLYTALELLPEEVPALSYYAVHDTLHFSGTGDPGFFHPYFNDSTAYKHLTSFDYLIWHSGNYADERFAPGWAWEDYPNAFSTERSVLPIYGNTVQILPEEPLRVIPAFFTDSTSLSDVETTRFEYRNQFRVRAPVRDTVILPFITESEKVKALLESVIGKHVAQTERPMPGIAMTLNGMSRDSICRKMMVESDNFLAEQLMILAASQIADTLSFKMASDRMLNGPLVDLRHPPRWVDGSGLSRYNLFTPQWIVGVLHKMYRKYPSEQLFDLFPAGGVSGTLKKWYADPNGPYVFAKSGTLGNNYNLSGYLRADSGKILIFSIMNNHFRSSNQDIRQQIDHTLSWIKSNY